MNSVKVVLELYNTLGKELKMIHSNIFYDTERLPN